MSFDVTVSVATFGPDVSGASVTATAREPPVGTTVPVTAVENSLAFGPANVKPVTLRGADPVLLTKTVRLTDSFTVTSPNVTLEVETSTSGAGAATAVAESVTSTADSSVSFEATVSVADCDPTAVGEKVTSTGREAPGATRKADAPTANSDAFEPEIVTSVTLSEADPVLLTSTVRVAVSPTVTSPKSSPDGVTATSGAVVGRALTGGVVSGR